MKANIEIEYDDLDDLRSILRGLRQREARERRTLLNRARIVAIESLADALEQHIHDVSTARLIDTSAEKHTVFRTVPTPSGTVVREFNPDAAINARGKGGLSAT